MKKIIFCAIFLLNTFGFLFAEAKAKDLVSEASLKSDVNDSISYIKKQIPTLTVLSEKRAAYIFLARIQEQLSLYEDAQKNYVSAAAISAGDAEGMPKRTNEQLVLDAVRCALCLGDSATADSYLNSAVRNSKNTEILSYVKLYTQWSALCRANSVEDLQEPLELLKAYLKIDSMKLLHPVILLTLWYVTGDVVYSNQITKNYPSSTEAAIVKGDVQLLPTPFWFFVPKSGIAEQGSGTLSSAVEISPSSTSNSTSADGASSTKASGESASTQKSPKFSKWQLGLFRTESNAKLLADELKTKGFSAYVTSETRSSGTTYYIVLVDETKAGNVADSLRSAGYDCYPVE